MTDALNKIAALGRVGLRLTWLGGEILFGAARYAVGPADHGERCLWLHRICRRTVRIFGLKSQITGDVPRRGLLVANHLSYLDIIVLASLHPCVFVSKSEVAAWPVFGWFARHAGTIFINRRCRVDVARTGDAIRAALHFGALVVLFPEGTTSDGATVRPFKSSLLEPVTGARVPMSVGALSYAVEGGDERHDVCYWGDHTLVPHLLRLMSKRRVHASLSFSEVRNTRRDRKKLALQLHSEVVKLHGHLRRTRSTVSACLVRPNHMPIWQSALQELPSPNLQSNP